MCKQTPLDRVLCGSIEDIALEEGRSRDESVPLVPQGELAITIQVPPPPTTA